MTTMSPARTHVLGRIADGLARRARQDGGLRVAVDGPDGAGKTRFARQLDDLLVPLLPEGAEVQRFSTDHLMIPAQQRRGPQGADPRWLYENVYDLPRIRDIALGGHPDRTGDVLIAEGMTLLRPELADLWDVTLYLFVPESVSLVRLLERDADVYGGADRLSAAYRDRYFPALAIYRDVADPVRRADVLIDMHDADKPVVVRWGGF